MSKIVNVGLVQMNSKLGNVEENVKKAVNFIKQASYKKADIVCLPELFATGYNLDILKNQTNILGENYYDFILKNISEAAKKYKVFVIAPFAEVRGIKGVLYNSAVLFDDEGNVLGSYAKTHLCGSEKLYYRKGSDYKVFNTKLGKIGIIICYDAGFPEACRILALEGADMIFIPAAWRIQDEYMWDLNLAQRALENVLFTIGVNRVGIEGDLHLFGKSKVCAPNSSVIKELPKDLEEVEVVGIDLNDLSKFRSEIPYLRDRNPLIYKKIVEEY
ncbi:carbon-nitrogen hydrolase [Clostridium autoethanogenum]|uniref:Carbon-nitrogen hydrolase n=1 Tax=Clostridium autoethanogenum TaxID=84023 RepID=A0A3M0SPP8_9CLOT|nr:nitrilase-related carbon-nitrogen hydrolase [Clostridium autoethanogenum]RMC99630.1 carbon-nitrogen hydrolase [Clostridium autoethanogenum]